MKSDQVKSKKEVAKFAASHRGQLILGQALAYAIKHIESQPEHLKEYSNMKDMEYIGEGLFETFFVLYHKNNGLAKAVENMVGGKRKDEEN
jgi:hypothetical protein